MLILLLLADDGDNDDSPGQGGTESEGLKFSDAPGTEDDDRKKKNAGKW